MTRTTMPAARPSAAAYGTPVPPGGQDARGPRARPIHGSQSASVLSARTPLSAGLQALHLSDLDGRPYHRELRRGRRGRRPPVLP